jgi:hypothetical protein
VVTKAEAYALQFNGPRLEFTLMQGGTRHRLQAPVGAVAAGRTYHVVGTYDGTTQRLYLNGVQVGSRAQAGSVTVGTWPLSVGAWAGWGEYFRGTVDEVAVYNKALTASRVADHHAAGGTTPVAAAAARTASPPSKPTRQSRALGPAQRLTVGLRGPGVPARRRACGLRVGPDATAAERRQKAVAARACRTLRRLPRR